MGYYNSFVVRIWSDGQGRLRGKIEHVASHESLVFLEPERIVGFIRSHLNPPPGGAAYTADGQAQGEENSIDGTLVESCP